MVPVGSLPCAQNPATASYPEPEVLLGHMNILKTPMLVLWLVTLFEIVGDEKVLEEHAGFIFGVKYWYLPASLRV